MTRRTAIKWLHWISFGLIVWFYIFEPPKSFSDPGGILSTHAGMGVILGIAVVIWFSIYALKGAASRPGPKLPTWARIVHTWKHRLLYFGLPVMMLTGAAAGLLAPFAIRAFGVVPLGPAQGPRDLYKQAEVVHDMVFNALVLVIILHAAFHIWRHYWLRDNALRIMTPRVVHRFLK